MMQQIHQKAKSLIIKHESYRQFLYHDTTNHLTIGFGHNIEKNGMSMTMALNQLDEDVEYWISQLNHKLPLFTNLSYSRQAVLIDMAFNMGLNGLFEFKDMFLALEREDYKAAAKAMMDSKWSLQVGQRAIEDSYIMEYGELNV